MPITPSAFLNEALPELYAKGVALLRAKAESGDAKAKSRLDNVVNASGTGQITIPGHATVWLTVGNGTMKATADRPAGVPVRLVAEFPAEAAVHLLKLAEQKSVMGDDRAAIAAARTSSKRFEDAVAGKKLIGTFTLKEPEILYDDVVVRFALNADALPDKPAFTAELKYEDLMQVVSKKLQPQQLLTTGKLRLKGDYSAAMQIAMQMMAQAGKK
jgi:putative sterol carrier protein